MSANLPIENSLVLIVDDLPENIQVLGAVVKAEHFNVALATSGAQALKIASAKKPDLILLDVTMPVMDGFEVCEQLKADPETAHIPVIFLTARVDIADIVRGFQAGAVDYIAKPFNSSELIARVRTHLELKKSREKILMQKNQLEAITETLKEENRAKDVFFSIMAHDLKSPFGGMIGICEILFASGDVPSKNDCDTLGMTLLETIKSQYKLFEELLEWGKLRIRRSKPNNRIFELMDIIDGISVITMPALNNKGISFSHNVPNDALCYGDISLISTVVRNLIVNAVKFTPRGGQIILDYKDLGERISISIVDNGIGMDQAMIDSLFRIDKISSRPGTNDEAGNGLGLIICDEIIKQSGGKILVGSKVGEGTVFSFKLPKNGSDNED